MGYMNEEGTWVVGEKPENQSDENQNEDDNNEDENDEDRNDDNQSDNQNQDSEDQDSEGDEDQDDEDQNDSEDGEDQDSDESDEDSDNDSGTDDKDDDEDSNDANDILKEILDDDSDDDDQDDDKDDDKDDDSQNDHSFEIKIGDETLNAESATERINELTEKIKTIEKDDFLSKFNEHYLNGGDPLDYLKANTDLEDGMSSLDLVKQAFMKENSDISTEAAERLWKRELKGKYLIGVDAEAEGYSEDDLEDGKAILERDAAKIKKSIKENKGKFQIKTRDNVVSEELITEKITAIQAEAQEKARTQMDKWSKAVNEHPSTKTMKKKGNVSVKYNGKKLGYKVADAAEVTEMTTDFRKIVAKISKDGVTDIEKMNRLAAFVQDMDRYDETLIKYGANTNKRETVIKDKNISKGQKGGKKKTNPERKKPTAGKQIANQLKTGGWKSHR